MPPAPAYDVNVDELRVALSYANSNVVLTPLQVTLSGLPSSTGLLVSKPVSFPETKSKEIEQAPAPTPAASENPVSKSDEDDDDFDVFGDDDEEEAPKKEISPERAEMLAKLKKEAEERTAAKEAKQRTLVAIEIKPWDVEQDLILLWKKITETISQDGLKWGENCTLADVAFGIKKIQTTFVMGVKNSSDDVVEAILAMEDEVQSCEVTSMNVL